MEHDLEKARNLETNFSKSELFYFGEAQNEDASYVKLFGPGIGIFYYLSRYSDSLPETHKH
jgi:hypothetical protein